MCEHGNDVVVMVKIPGDLACDGKERWDEKNVDACIAPIVKALQEGGIDMRGSCCGHGKGLGEIDLQDGRTLVVVPPGHALDPVHRTVSSMALAAGA